MATAFRSRFLQAEQLKRGPASKPDDISFKQEQRIGEDVSNRPHETAMT